MSIAGRRLQLVIQVRGHRDYLVRIAVYFLRIAVFFEAANITADVTAMIFAIWTVRLLFG
ncbi:MAG: hypothetical protein M3336_17230 [Chloroflexota bacterium]|nr:hypothetical protein [Chloroflexota bacterium]